MNIRPADSVVKTLREALAINRIIPSDDFNEAISAVLEARPAVFKRS